ncbi:hypothetical protein WME90_19200 [Sorangium sp. So ce375]|uniref:hypothetical protein n=1 Tax=Sorangium sp. So ce375 TaxID=3133306 RepID=UPI003F5BBD91
MATPATVHVNVELPSDLEQLRLPAGVDRRLQALLDKQDRGEKLSADEAIEAEGLVDLAELLSLLRLRASRKEPVPAG